MQEMSAVRRMTQRPFPAAARLDIHAVSRPARRFTGDFYVLHRHRDHLWFAHGDVAGKGLPAAIVMAMIQEEIEHRISACAETSCDPAATTRRLHEFLAPLLPRNRFATAVIGSLADDGTLTITNAGHCPPIIRRAGGTVETLDSTGPLLGILPNAQWRSVTVALEPGDALVLYSDGVLEGMTDGAELGLEGVSRRSLTGESASEIASSILDRLETSDDVTLVVVRRDE